MIWEKALILACEEAECHRGATSPNPPVGAVGLDSVGNILAVAAHPRVGEPHAERELLKKLESLGLSHALHTLLVTLEPCSHYGRTPPCTDAILASGASRVVFAVRDPHPKAGGGGLLLSRSGIEVICLSDLALTPELQVAQRQLAPFLKVIRTGRPWITVKRALDDRGLMIPPPGRKTFTSQESLRLAHQLRRRADAILTGSGTVLADRPELTVRHVPDHDRKKRFLVIADRTGRMEREAPDYLDAASARGFEVLVTDNWQQSIQELTKQGVVEVLVEAGPKLSEAVLRTEWDEHWIFQKTAGETDTMFTSFSDSRLA